MTENSSKKLIFKAASKKVIDKNAQALKLYRHYKRVSDLIERTDVALGRKAILKAGPGSTLNFEINQHGIASTTTQKI
jgi:hypothetical protein